MTPTFRLAAVILVWQVAGFGLPDGFVAELVAAEPDAGKMVAGIVVAEDGTTLTPETTDVAAKISRRDLWDLVERLSTLKT